jgi:protein SCO1
MLAKARAPVLALIAVLIFLVLGTAIGFLQSGGRAPGQVQQGGPVIAPFQLVDQMGRAVSERDILGRPAVLSFGFTYCPDVCPVTLASLSASLKTLGADAEGLGVFFVSVDPERDTPEVIKAYLSAFDPRIRGLTGEPKQIAVLAKSLGIYHAKVAAEGGNYSVDHTSSVILLDAKGRFHSTIAYGEDPAVAVAKLQRLLRGEAG